MDFSGFKKGQKDAILSAGKPLFIQAGAGTGKTFTLTKRIAYGLLEESGPLIEDVSRLLTITFTNKAAAELIGRIRAELRAEGLDEDSLQIDAAWISTIHAMCNRMLSDHAFEAGIDPGAGLLSDDEAKALSKQAMDLVLQEQTDNDKLRILLEMNDSKETIELIQTLSDVLAVAPGGMGDFEFGPKPTSVPIHQIQDLLESLCDARDELEEIGYPDEEKYFAVHAKLVTVINKLRGALEKNDCAPTWSDLVVSLKECEVPKGGKLKNPYKDIYSTFRKPLEEFFVLVYSSASYQRLQAACELAVEHLQRYGSLKQELGVLDTNDLLIGAYFLLLQNPDIAKAYRDMFQSIMIDEFQDTDNLQVNIVKMIADEGLSTVATVGDAQQSIYGFRGADLEIYQEMRNAMKRCGSDEAELTSNFRSHADILAFVEEIFYKPEFFGNGFLRVESGHDVQSVPSWIGAKDPRVMILLTAGTKSIENKRLMTNVDRLRIADAKALADEFQQLHEQDNGASYGDMAILVRSTKGTHIGAYLDEFRRRGIPCVVSGGSDFFEQPEVTIMSMLLRVLANRDDDEALFNLLGSDFFDASDDDLLLLSETRKKKLRVKEGDARSKASFYDALLYCIKQDGKEAPQSFMCTKKTLEEAVSSARNVPIAQVLRNAVTSSGWEQTLARRGVEGGAVFANVDRVCDWIEEYETRYGRSLFGASEYLRNLIDPTGDDGTIRAKPGVLVSSQKDAVQIMTIHSSKGLEFPIVAVAEFTGGSGGGDKVVSLSEDSKRYLAIRASKTNSIPTETPTFMQTSDTADYASYARQLAEQREAQEAQRLLYVALTRARDMLILVAHDGGFGSAGKLTKGLTADIFAALYGEDVPTEDDTRHTQTGALMKLSITTVPYESQDLEEGQDDEGVLTISHFYETDTDAPHISSQAFKGRVIHSYSSLAHQDEDSKEPVAQAIALRDRSKDADTVSPVGSAFHLVAQWIAMAPAAQRDALDARLQAAARRYDLDDEGKQRLVSAVQAWVSSELFARTQSYERRLAEYPFCVDVDGAALEGYIDLVCFDSSGNALVVDYKTGVSGEGEDLHDRYEFQAACYAYALISTNVCNHVDVVFVRPEANMEEVAFSFDEGMILSLDNHPLTVG